MSSVGADVHKTADGVTGTVYRKVAEPFAELIKQHNGNGFHVFAESKSAEGGYGHKEAFVKNFTVNYILSGFPDYIAADYGIRDN